MSELSNKIAKKRQKTAIKAYAFLCLVIAVGMGFYSYSNFMKYDSLKKGLAKNESIASELHDAVANENAVYESKKNDFDELNETISDSLSSIFPDGDYYTELTKKMDEIEQKLSTKSNPFEISSIDFQNPVEGEIFSALPFRMNIRSSNQNFIRFLHLIENSGSFDSDLRLMDIPSIRLSFQRSNISSEDNIISFSLQLNAYFQ